MSQPAGLIAGVAHPFQFYPSSIDVVVGNDREEEGEVKDVEPQIQLRCTVQYLPEQHPQIACLLLQRPPLSRPPSMLVRHLSVASVEKKATMWKAKPSSMGVQRAVFHWKLPKPWNNAVQYYRLQVCAAETESVATHFRIEGRHQATDLWCPMDERGKVEWSPSSVGGEEYKATSLLQIANMLAQPYPYLRLIVMGTSAGKEEAILPPPILEIWREETRTSADGGTGWSLHARPDRRLCLRVGAPRGPIMLIDHGKEDGGGRSFLTTSVLPTTGPCQLQLSLAIRSTTGAASLTINDSKEEWEFTLPGGRQSWLALLRQCPVTVGGIPADVGYSPQLEGITVPQWKEERSSAILTPSAAFLFRSLCSMDIPPAGGIHRAWNGYMILHSQSPETSSPKSTCGTTAVAAEVALGEKEKGAAAACSMLRPVRPLSSFEELMMTSFHVREGYAGWGEMPMRVQRPQQVLVCHDCGPEVYGADAQPSMLWSPATALSTPHTSPTPPRLYRLHRWDAVDVFVYFAHHRVNPPPSTWIAAARANGTKVLGTVITEWQEGFDANQQLLYGITAPWTDEALRLEGSPEEVLNQLVACMVAGGFDGWLFNIEADLRGHEDAIAMRHAVRSW